MLDAKFIEAGRDTVYDRKERANHRPNEADVYYKAQTK